MISTPLPCPTCRGDCGTYAVVYPSPALRMEPYESGDWIDCPDCLDHPGMALCECCEERVATVDEDGTLMCETCYREETT